MDILNFISWIKSGRQVSTVDAAKTLVPLGLRDAKRDDGYLSGAITVEDLLALVDTSIQGESYILVKGKGDTPAENGAELKAAYDTAVAATPYGNVKSATNDFTILVAPGTYDMSAYNGSFGWELNEDYVNIVSLSGVADVIITTFCVQASYATYKGLNTRDTGGFGSQILINSGVSDLVFDTCIAGDYSFGAGITQSAITYKNCTAGVNSFGSSMVIFIPPFYIQPPQSTPQTVFLNNCTFENCSARQNSFGAARNDVDIVGCRFTNCIAISGNAFGSAGQFGPQGGNAYIQSSQFKDCESTGPFAFGANAGFSTGSVLIDSAAEFDNCKGVDRSFGCSLNGNTGTVVGIMKNCTGTNNCFAFNPFTRQGVASGTFENCRTTSGGTFGGAMADGVFINCQAGTPYGGGATYSFGAGDPGTGYASGSFMNCAAYGDNTFGNATANGIFTNCYAGGNFAFGKTADGTFNHCTAGDFSFSWQGFNTYGLFNHCIGGSQSFANIDPISTSLLYGRAAFCIKENGTYYTSPGVTTNVLACVDSAKQLITI